MIEVKSLNLEYDSGQGGKTVAIENISFQIRKEESLAIIGPSGCGKTSLLYVLAGLIEPTAGKVKVKDEEVKKPCKDVALILQTIGLLPWKTIWRNITLGLNLSERSIRTRIKKILKELGIENLVDRYPAQLSEGQRKRAGIARALARTPKILLMDEPLSSLDAITKEKIQNTILKLWKEQSLTMILITHDVAEAVFLGERILVLSDRPAYIKAKVSNPGMGEVKYRNSEDFHLKARELRSYLL